MAKVIVALLLFSLNLMAGPLGTIKDTSITNIDDTYSGAANEFIAGTTNPIGGILIVNPTSTDLYACVYALAVGDCADDMLIPAGSWRGKKSNYIRGLRLRVKTGTLSSGDVEGSGE